MRRIPVVTALALALTLAPGALAQSTTWQHPGTGDWMTAGHWTMGTPLAGWEAQVDNGGTAQLIAGATPLLDVLFLGRFFNTSGALQVQGGTLNTHDLIVGNIGSGQLTLSAGGTIDSTVFAAANNNNGDASITMTGGTFNAGTTFLAVNAAADMTQSAGDFLTIGLVIANNGGTVGEYTLTGGTSTNTGITNLGVNGSATFTQSGGDAAWSLFLMLGRNAGSSGAYHLQGGTCFAEHIRPAENGGSSTFDFTGGVLHVNQFGSVGMPLDLVNAGGVLTPGGAGSTGATHIRGDWTQSPAATVTFDLLSPSDHDQVIVSEGGTVTLDGALNLNFNLATAPSLTQTYILIDNDGVDPIAGAFVGYPEGSTVTAYHDGTPYIFGVSYLGGDGNDMILTTCVADASGNGMVDFDDMNIVLNNWGAMGVGVPGDLDGSGTVDFDDLNLVFNTWGSSCV